MAGALRRLASLLALRCAVAVDVWIDTDNSAGVGGGVRPATAVTAPSNIVAVPHDARPADTSHPSRAVRRPRALVVV